MTRRSQNPHVVELGVELEPRGAVQQRLEVVVLLGRVVRHRRVEEPPLAHVHASEEHPVALQRRVERAVRRHLGEA